MDPAEARRRLLAMTPLAERRLDLAGVSTSVLEGGEGAPMILLHGPGEFAAKWMFVASSLLRTHRVIAPDLPGHGGSEVRGGPLDADRVLTWLGELIGRTCTAPPVLVGHGLAVAALYAVHHANRLDHLVLVDALGLEPFEPDPAFATALDAFAERPDGETYDALWQRCVFDLNLTRAHMGERWDLFKAYNLDRARSASLKAALHVLMGEMGAAIPSAELERITVPTTLVWGRHDLATPLRIAAAASSRYGWTLRVIENASDDPALEQPGAFHAALKAVLDVVAPTRGT